MNKVDKLLRLRNIYKYLLIFVVAVITVMTIIYLTILPKESNASFDVDSTYKVDLDNQIKLLEEPVYWEHIDGTLEEITVPGDYDVDKNEVMTLVTRLPKVLDNSILEIRSSQSIVRIYINDELRTCYDTEKTRPIGTQTTSRYVFCNLHSADSGSEVRIELVSGSKDYSGVVNEIYIGNETAFIKMILDNYGPSFYMGIVNIIVGMFALLIGIAIRYVYKFKSTLIYIGSCVTLAGFWIFGASKIVQFVFPNLSWCSDVCYLIVIICPIPVALMLDDVGKGRYRTTWCALITSCYLNLIFQVLLQITNVADYLDMLLPSHIIVAGTIVAVIVTFILDIRKKKIKEYGIIAIGLSFFLCFVALELVMSYFVKITAGVFITIGTISLTLLALVMTIADVNKRLSEQHEEKIREQKLHTEAMTMQLIRTLSNTIEAKDDYKHGHSFRVSEYSTLIARKMGLDEKRIEKLSYSASLHDIGKIGVPDTILNKVSRLTDKEFDVIRTHTTIGADIIKKVESISFAEDVARHHHERYDGKGYPDGIGNEEISLEARIVCVADAYDAMNSKRIYRNSYSKEVIRKEINRNKGIQFDPYVVDAFLELFDSGELDSVDSCEKLRNENRSSNSYLYDTSGLGMALSEIMSTAISSSNEDIDYLTGLPMRGKGEELIKEKIKQGNGMLLFCDMDNLKVINDRFGHKAGDAALSELASILKTCYKDSVACRIGGDEFLLFLSNISEEESQKIVTKIIEDFNNVTKGNTVMNGAGVSLGGCATNEESTLSDVICNADKALYFVKQRGKNSYYIYRGETFESENKSIDMDIIKKAVRTAGEYDGALDMEYRDFTKMYEYIGKVCARYKHSRELVLITLETIPGYKVYIDDTEKAMNALEMAIRGTIRNVDVCTRYSSVQFLLILLEAGYGNTDDIMKRIFTSFHNNYGSNNLLPSYRVAVINNDET